MKRVGLHLRQTDSFGAVVQRARRLHLPFFQCFLNVPSTKRLMQVSDDQIARYLREDRPHFDAVYLHASYWINLATCQYDSMRLLRRELALAHKLEFTHVVLHAGAANGCASRAEGVENLARGLNTFFKETTLPIILENTAHANLSVGGDIQDFVALLNKLDQPEKLTFCIDTSHAHAFGYDIVTPKEQDAFMKKLDDTLGSERIVLLHVNDTHEVRGSKIDQHALPGEGKIGKKALARFVHHPVVQHVPIIIEPPAVAEQVLRTTLETVTDWCT